MSIEVTVLLAATILGLVHVLVASQAATSQRGVKWNLSSREQKAPELTGVAGRLDRASKNFQETFPFFVAAVVIVRLAGQTSQYSALGAQIYIIARLAYFPVYAAGITVLRSLIWLTSLAGIALICFSAVYA